MVKHGMDVVSRDIEFLNPSQVPAIAMDQRLYATAKQIQWKWPEQSGVKIDTWSRSANYT